MTSTNSLEMHSFLVGRQTSGSNDVWSDTATRSFKVKEYEHVYVFIHITDFVFSNPSIGYFHKFSEAIDKNSFLVLVSFILVYFIVIRLTVFLSVLASSFSSKVMNWLNAFCSWDFQWGCFHMGRLGSTDVWQRMNESLFIKIQLIRLGFTQLKHLYLIPLLLLMVESSPSLYVNFLTKHHLKFWYA